MLVANNTSVETGWVIGGLRGPYKHRLARAVELTGHDCDCDRDGIGHIQPVLTAVLLGVSRLVLRTSVFSMSSPAFFPSQRTVCIMRGNRLVSHPTSSAELVCLSISASVGMSVTCIWTARFDRWIGDRPQVRDNTLRPTLTRNRSVHGPTTRRFWRAAFGRTCRVPRARCTPSRPAPAGRRCR